MREACRQASALCAERRTNMGSLALRFSMALPGVTSTFIGIGSLAELHANLATWADNNDESLMREVRAILAP